MALTEKLIKERAVRTPERYAARVRWLAVVYFALNLLSVGIIVTIVWRVQFFITLTQRSNVETLVLLIILVLAIYYLASTFRGFIGALRIVWYNLPRFFSRDKETATRVERRKHAAIKPSSSSKSAYFDLAIRLRGKSDEPIKWRVGDAAGKLGELEVQGVEAKYFPLKDGLNDAFFEFLADQIENVLQTRDMEAKLQITEWSTIDEDKAASYHSMVQAFQNLEKQLGKGEPVWPAAEITEEDVRKIEGEIEKVVPALRNEAFLPDVEYEVQWNVPVLPEPLNFMQLSRRENRADPVITMGCAVFVMLTVMIIVLFFIILPPWVPSK